ncbi:MAG: 30S ribosomal protein S2 [bacterium]|nr:30S ribosomal protein S2 [bacterium]
MPKTPELKELLEAGAHFGHQASRWHPKMAEFIFGMRSGIHVINLEKTQEQLEKVLTRVQEVAARGGTVLFVGTKSQAKPFVKAAALDCGMPFVTERWLGGTLTNFKQIRDTVDRYLKLKEQQEKGELGKYTKLERLLISRQVEDYNDKVGGIATLKKLPDLVFVTDVRFDKTALMEANSVHVPVIGVCDTNVNPTRVQHVIPMNDDAVRSIELVTKLIADAVKEGKANPVVVEKKGDDKNAKKPIVKTIASKPAAPKKAVPEKETTKDS